MVKVLFLIYNNTSGAGGGSFHSLAQHVVGLNERINAQVINVGVAPSSTLSNLRCYRYISYERWNIVRFIELLQAIRRFSPDVIHAYDHKALFLGRVASLLLGIPVVFTKCGGRNGSTVIPFASRHILFSGENLAHFRMHGEARRCQLIPNRLARPSVDISHGQRLIEELKLQGRRILLRISRFNRYYDLTFRQAAELHKALSAQGEKWSLVFVGTVQDSTYFAELQQRVDRPDVHFVTDTAFTSEASRLIPIADAVIATGRGAMEACAYNKRVFCPSSSAELPVELDESTFETAFFYNFSERAPLPQGPVAQAEKAVNTKAFFDKYFLMEAAADRLISLYEEVSREGPERLSNIRTLAYHALQFFRVR